MKRFCSNIRKASRFHFHYNNPFFKIQGREANLKTSSSEGRDLGSHFVLIVNCWRLFPPFASFTSIVTSDLSSGTLSTFQLNRPEVSSIVIPEGPVTNR